MIVAFIVNVLISFNKQYFFVFLDFKGTVKPFEAPERSAKIKI